MNYHVKEDGFTLVPSVLERRECTEWIDCLGPVPGAGMRQLLTLPELKDLATSARLMQLVRPYLPGTPVPVRGIYFDKSPEINWIVPWHQDLTLAFKKRVELPGFGPWSVKEGIPHVQPPVDLLMRMITLRLHLDDADESNGALRVLSGSHRLGRLTPQQIQDLRQEVSATTCTAAAGDALLMRPLLLHASGRSTSGRHRRVLHFEYAGFDLPSGLEWHG
jgi:hypothetical protein